MSGGIIALIVVLAVLFVALMVAVWIIVSRNNFVKMQNNIDEAFSNMDVYLKKRYDLIPNLVETVKGYAKHEKETLAQVMEARNSAMNATGADKVQKENALTGTLRTLYAVAENYPQLKADTHFTSLMANLKSVEDDILNARKYYNGNVKMFNTKIDVFPSSLIAKWFKFEKRELFEIANEERENVKVKF